MHRQFGDPAEIIPYLIIASRAQEHPATTIQSLRRIAIVSSPIQLCENFTEAFVTLYQLIGLLYNQLMLWKIEGYLVIPHELLHVLAYRLIGKKCAYQLGDHYVHALESRTLGEKLFVLLFPLFIIGGLGLGLILLWAALYVSAQYPANPFRYFSVAPGWHQCLWFAAVTLLLYASASLFDLIIVGRLLLQKLRHQPPNDANKNQNEWTKPQQTYQQ